MMSIITGMDTSSPLDRPSVGARAPALRARVTNHKDLLPGLDGRSATARRFRDLVNAFVADMGGLDRCSEIRLGLVRRLAATTVQAEMLEARMVNGEAIDIATLCTLPPINFFLDLGNPRVIQRIRLFSGGDSRHGGWHRGDCGNDWRRLAAAAAGSEQETA
jgi:hypothetical protein